MSIQERILLSLSRPPASEEQGASHSEWTIDNALSLLEREYPFFRELVAGKSVLDFGSGFGFQSIALARNYDCHVVGIETNPTTLRKAREFAAGLSLPEGRLSFTNRVSQEMEQSFDVVISQNSFEHFNDPSSILKEMRLLAKDSGKILVTFGPPWLAPYGSHMRYFCKVPWINVLFSEDAVMRVRSRYRTDGATKYDEVESGLNKMTIRRFERIVAESKLKLDFKRYKGVKGVHFLCRVPYLREFFVNHISACLSKM